MAGLAVRAERPPPCGRGRTLAPTLEARTAVDASVAPLHVCPRLQVPDAQTTADPTFPSATIFVKQVWAKPRVNEMSFPPLCRLRWRYGGISTSQRRGLPGPSLGSHTSPTQRPEYPPDPLRTRAACSSCRAPPRCCPRQGAFPDSLHSAASLRAGSLGFCCFRGDFLLSEPCPMPAFCTLLRVDEICLLLLTHSCPGGGVSDDTADFKKRRLFMPRLNRGTWRRRRGRRPAGRRC